ncbi:MAG TPA: response regulator [Ferruginibacter sp.]|nr:response regulator [Ferruginibacter sp.]HPH90522.1 response regulator [Ferruginibacter sp.]
MNAKENIVILDDDEDIGQMLKMMLEFKNYNVTLINRVDKIIPALKSQQYQLLILDMLIAGDNGCDLCRALKKNEALSPLPVLMFSALPDGKNKAMDAGADDFIAKPFDMESMLSKVTILIDKNLKKRIQN